MVAPLTLACFAIPGKNAVEMVAQCRSVCCSRMCLVLFAAYACAASYVCDHGGSRIVGLVDNSGKNGSQKSKDSTVTVIGTMSAGVNCGSAVFRLRLAVFGCILAVLHFGCVSALRSLSVFSGS
jgi:hypothetical protein